jgi:hypothetical protein
MGQAQEGRLGSAMLDIGACLFPFPWAMVLIVQSGDPGASSGQNGPQEIQRGGLNRLWASQNLVAYSSKNSDLIVVTCGLDLKLLPWAVGMAQVV